MGTSGGWTLGSLPCPRRVTQNDTATRRSGELRWKPGERPAPRQLSVTLPKHRSVGNECPRPQEHPRRAGAEPGRPRPAPESAPTEGGTRGHPQPAPSSAGGPRGSHRSARRRPLRPAPVAAAKTRRRHPARPRASAPPCEPHWACSAPAGSGCCRWGAPHSRPPAAQPASLPGAGGHSLPAVGAPGHRARGVERRQLADWPWRGAQGGHLSGAAASG